MDRKIALLSNITIDMVAAKLRKKYTVFTPGGYDAWISEVLDGHSELYTERHDAYFLIFDGMELKHADAETVQERIALWKSGVQRLAENVGAVPVFISTVDFQESAVKTYAERKQYLAYDCDWYEFVQKLCESHSNVYVLDLLNAVMNIGRRRFYSNKMWYMGSMPYSKEGIAAVASEIDMAAEAAFGQRKKVLVLDLDNTIWGGVIGEDGVDGIELSSHKEGARFYDFQKQILEMKKRGVVLSINSKNNEPDVEEAFCHPHMVLKREDFVDTKINWQDKPANLKETAIELNLTEGSFVFIDDNPMEREMVSGQCGEAAVPEFPDDTTRLAEFAEDVYMRYFRQVRTTDEDLKKTLMYQSDMKRKQVAGTALSLDDYIRALEIRADIHRMRESELERVHQLITKTNQFNLTTKRYSIQEVRELNESSDIFTVSASDKFGDNGLVAVVVCKKDGADVVLDSFLMSCRVMGRKLEKVIIGALAQEFSGFERLVASYIPTARNVPVADLYERLGFTQIDETDGVKKYELKLDSLYPKVGSYAEIKTELERGMRSL